VMAFTARNSEVDEGSVRLQLAIDSGRLSCDRVRAVVGGERSSRACNGGYIKAVARPATAILRVAKRGHFLCASWVGGAEVKVEVGRASYVRLSVLHSVYSLVIVAS
jgi:hypothetical protein